MFDVFDACCLLFRLDFCKVEWSTKWLDGNNDATKSMIRRWGPTTDLELYLYAHLISSNTLNRQQLNRWVICCQFCEWTTRVQPPRSSDNTADNNYSQTCTNWSVPSFLYKPHSDSSLLTLDRIDQPTDRLSDWLIVVDCQSQIGGRQLKFGRSIISKSPSSLSVQKWISEIKHVTWWWCSTRLM